MNQLFLNEEDIKTLFGRKKTTNLSKKSSWWKLYLKFAALFVSIFMITFLVVNFNALSKNMRYLWQVQIRHKSYGQAIATPEPKPSFDPTASAKLIIPKIGVEAPIIWNISEEDIPEKLLEGVVHYQGTAMPDQKGNVFITGHSSYYSWSSSPYKDIFALLEKISVGDKIYIQYQGKNLTYEVKDTKVVSPRNVEVMDQTSDYRLTLMTCVPIGTNLNRLIITSIQAPN